MYDITDVTFTFWFKWSYFFPQNANLENLRSHYTSVATVSETDRGTMNLGDRFLSLWIAPFEMGIPAYAFSTYDNGSRNPNV